MPCSDSRWYDEYLNNKEKSALKERNDVLIRCICYMDKYLSENDVNLLNLMMNENSELRDIIVEHRKHDNQ